jgi:hypothetical protein
MTHTCDGREMRSCNPCLWRDFMSDINGMIDHAFVIIRMIASRPGWCRVFLGMTPDGDATRQSGRALAQAGRSRAG